MKLLLISNSTNYKENYLGWCMPLIQEFLGQKEKKKIAFIPYAMVRSDETIETSYTAATNKVKKCFSDFGLNEEIISVHEVENPVQLINECDAIMVSGGNTFHLVYEIHRNKLIEPVRRKVMEGTPYFGWSAGSNVACPTLKTTNDMPIIMPESFQCFDLVPFQINPHYIDPAPQSVNDTLAHAGESRQERIEEFLPSTTFLRIHRSFIINLNKIVEVKKSHVVLEGDFSMPIGDNYKDAFMDYLNKRILTK